MGTHDIQAYTMKESGLKKGWWKRKSLTLESRQFRKSRRSPSCILETISTIPCADGWAYISWAGTALEKVHNWNYLWNPWQKSSRSTPYQTISAFSFPIPSPLLEIFVQDRLRRRLYLWTQTVDWPTGDWGAWPKEVLGCKTFKHLLWYYWIK